MKTLSQVIETLSSGKNASQNKEGMTQQVTRIEPPNPLLLGETPLRDNLEAQNQLTRLLEQTYACQKTYADKAEMMEYRDGMFQMILENYAFFEIKEAFIEFVRTKPDLPTPSEILIIIERLRIYRFIKKPDIETLKIYREKGITLSKHQMQILKDAES